MPIYSLIAAIVNIVVSENVILGNRPQSMVKWLKPGIEFILLNVITHARIEWMRAK